MHQTSLVTLFATVAAMSGCALAHERVLPVDGWPTPRDGGVPNDASSAACFRPMDVRTDPCITCDDSSPYLFFWNGTDCDAVHTNCATGSDVANTVATLDECLARFASCPPMVCRATNGVWRSEPEFCGFVCGHESANECFRGMPGCECQPGQTFGLNGCAADPTCGPEDNCAATGGQWVSACPLDECFHPRPECDGPATYCDCGFGRGMNEAGTGCTFVAVPDICLTPGPQTVCESSGGTWTVNELCGPTVCGREMSCQGWPIIPSCRCGPLETFDAEHGGCRFELTCERGPREVGEACTTEYGGPKCAPSLTCDPNSLECAPTFCALPD